MSVRRIVAVLIPFLVLVDACGGDAASTTSADSTTVVTTTTVASPSTTTTTTPPLETRPLAGLVAAPVEDPLYGSGFYEMTFTDASGTSLVSTSPLVGSNPGENLLGVGLMDPAPVTSGVGLGYTLVMAWVENPTAAVDPWPSAVVLYTEGSGGWDAVVSISDTIVLEFLQTTTDFIAWKPATGTPYARTTVKTLDWDGTTAHFTADVQVLVFPDPFDDFLAEVECDLGATLQCVLLSDDGVLRAGDQGDAVEALQSTLIDLGYLFAPADGKYGGSTESAVRNLQRDFRLDRDGEVGAQTRAMIDDIVAGNVVLASKSGLGSVSFGTTPEISVPALDTLVGPPDYTVGWEVGPCGTWKWYKVTWGGITAIFTERSGSRRFDGWEVTDLATVPSTIYFAGGVAPTWTWSNFVALGAGYDAGYQSWYHGGLGYGRGTFVSTPSNPPAATAKVRGFGTGTGAVLWDC